MQTKLGQLLNIATTSLILGLLTLSCSYSGTWMPLPVEGAQYTRTYNTNDTIELQRHGLALKVSGGWNGFRSTFRIQVSNSEKDVAGIDFERVRFYWEGGDARVASLIVSGKFYPFERRDYLYRKRIDEAGSEEKYRQSVPTLIPGRSEQMMEINFGGYIWKDYSEKLVFTLEIPFLIEQKEVVFKIPFRRSDD